MIGVVRVEGTYVELGAGEFNLGKVENFEQKTMVENLSSFKKVFFGEV